MSDRSYRSYGRSFKKFVGIPVSPSPERLPPGYEVDPRNPGKFRKPRARSISPSRDTGMYGVDEDYELSVQQNEAVDSIIQQINTKLGLDVDVSDQRVRWIIKKIIIVHGLTDITIEKIKLCKPLLYVISNALVIGLTATGTGIRNIAEVLLPAATELTIKLASLAGQGLAMGASMARDRFSRGANFLLSRQLEEPQIRARSPSPSRQMYAYAGEVVLPAVEFTRGVLSGLYRVLSQIFGSISTILSPCFGAAATSLRGVASRGVEQLCSLLTPEQAVGAAVDQVVQEGPDLECSICMDNAIQGAVVTSCGHRFHQSCIQEWFRQSRNRSCPYCRTSVTELTQPQYGGLKKYRSKTRTKSKSKSRRYVSKPHKSRKARKRVRYASSRRK